MDTVAAVDILSARRRGLAWSAVRAGLWAASKPYAAAMRLRRWTYRRELASTNTAAAPVISVGNLTTGGTGKTPMVARVIGWLKDAGYRPAILTRGYRAAEHAPGVPLSDEAEMLAQITGAEVVVNADRSAGAEHAVADGADVLVMDDGFQHQRLRRDLDIVLIDAVEPFGFGHCLPRGLLREPVSALADADAVVLTHTDEIAPDRLAELGRRVKALAPSSSHHAAVHAPTGLVDPDGGRTAPEKLMGRKVYAFCGLGSPEHFFLTLTGLGARLTGRRILADHAVYTQELLDDIAAEAARTETALLVTTQKDYVKLSRLQPPPGLCRLRVEVLLTGGGEALRRRVLDTAAGRQQAPGEATGRRGA